MLGLRAWGDDLVVVLLEFLEDDTKLAQSCTDWLYVQHWYTVVPDPATRVTLWALMTSKPSSMRLDGYLCEVCHTTFLCIPFCGRFLRCKYGRTVYRDSDASACVCSRGISIAWVPHGFVSICDVKQDLSFLSCSVTRPAVDAAMVLAPIARARRRACVILAKTFLLTIQSFPASSVVSKTCFFSFQARWHCRRCGWRMVRNIVC